MLGVSKEYRETIGSITGLLWAKSPIFTLNKKHGFLLALKVLDDQHETLDILALVMASSLATLKQRSALDFKLNEFVCIRGARVSKVNLGQGVKRSVLMLLLEACDSVKIILEHELQPCLPNFMSCKVNGCSAEPIAYEGTVTKIVSPSCLILDLEICVIGLSDFKPAQRLHLANVFRAPPSHSFIVSLASKLSLLPDHIFIFCPFFSTATCDRNEMTPLISTFYPTFDCKDAQKRLRTIMDAFDAARHANEVARAVWASKTIATMFVEMLEGYQDYFADFQVAKVSSLRHEISYAKDLTHTKRSAITRERIRGLLIGKTQRCRDTGVMKLVDDSGSVSVCLDRMEGLDTDRLVVVKESEMISELYLVDPISGSISTRQYLHPITYSSFDLSSPLADLTTNGSYFLMSVQSAPPLQIALIKPFTMESTLDGRLLCLVESSANGLNLKRMSKPASIRLTPSEYIPELTVGSFVIVEKGKTRMGLWRWVTLELDAGLSKGQGRLEGSLLFVSREVELYTSNASPPTCIRESIRTLLSSTSECLLHFRGILTDIQSVLSEIRSTVNPMFSRFFKTHGVGSPVANAEFILTIADEGDACFFVRVQYNLMNTKMLPLGLVPGAVVEGRHFLKNGDRLESHEKSSLHVIAVGDGLRDLALHKTLSDGQVAFHYLSDFYGYPTAHPYIPVVIQCFLLSIQKLILRATCKRCGGKQEVMQQCCPVHGSTGFEAVEMGGEMVCLVGDGAYEAELHFSTFETILAFLKLESRMAYCKDFCSRAGTISDPDLLVNKTRLLELTQARFRVKGVCTEAQAKCAAGQLVPRRIQAGRAYIQGWSYPGQVRISVLSVEALDLSALTRKYLSVLEEVKPD